MNLNVSINEKRYVARFHSKFDLDWFSVSPMRDQRIQIWPYFQLPHSVTAPSSSAETRCTALSIDADIDPELQLFNATTASTISNV